MDFRSAVTISTFLLLTVDKHAFGSNTSLSPAQTTSTSINCICPCTINPAAPTSSPSISYQPALGVLTFKWTSKCEGNLILHQHSFPSVPVCHDSNISIYPLGNVCENKKGCKGKHNLVKDKWQEGYHISESGAKHRTNCETLRVKCTVDVLPDVQGQLQAYKVVTALLCCLLLVLFLIRFTRPTVQALQKRLSNRRQNRWIGPTQSHSVSYHRGKSAVKSNDGEKRLSYPALERLAVSDSREPSSNRNSDYNF